MASFAAAFYTFSPLRDSLSSLNTPRAGYHRSVYAPVYRVPPPCACRCQVRDGCTTSYDHGARVLEWSRRLTANRAVLMYRYLRRRDEVVERGRQRTGRDPTYRHAYPGGHRGINRHRCRSRGALRLRIWCSR